MTEGLIVASLGSSEWLAHSSPWTPPMICSSGLMYATNFRSTIRKSESPSEIEDTHVATFCRSTRSNPLEILRTRVNTICEPKPAACRTTYCTSMGPPTDNRKSPNSGSGCLKLAIGGNSPRAKPWIETASSMPVPIGCPVNPFVFVMIIFDALSPKAVLSAWISAAAEPPRGGVAGSCDMNEVCLAIWWRLKPHFCSIREIKSFSECDTCSTSRRVGWNAELPKCVPNSSA